MNSCWLAVGPSLRRWPIIERALGRCRLSRVGLHGTSRRVVDSV